MSKLFRMLPVVLPVFLATFLPLQAQDTSESDTLEISSSTLSALRLRGIGAAFMSGRISDIAIDPVDRSTWYVTAASGGVWKTENAATTWKPVFDQYGSYSIGCITIDPNDRFTIWVGTGENNSQRSVGYGDGLYKSVDGGRSFEKVGLGQSEHIGMIIVDPRDSDVVYVAAQGPLWSSGGDRGVYKTTDGGENWERVLEVDEHTGANEIHFDPDNPDILYASTYQRRRHVWTLINGGPGSDIYKSTDAGASWRKINSGLPSVDKGKIGMDVSPINPEVLYAVVEAAEDKDGFFRSENGGESWTRMSDYVSGSPQYYNEIFADPHVFDRIYSMDTYMQVSEDGGKTFTRLGEDRKHVDNHAMAFDPVDPNHLIIGSDGGLYETWDRGKTYDFKENLSLSQYYKVAVDNATPFYNICGGTQDNATHCGPHRTTNIHGIRNSDWIVTVFGDGFDPAIDPENPNIIYSQWQYGGIIRYDRATGDRIDIKPRAQADGPPLRWNWDSALMISPHSHTRLYYGSQILFRSDDRGDSWEAVSPDLTRNLDRNTLEVMGRVWGPNAVSKNRSTSFYGTIVALTESPLEEDVLYVGTDDGLVQVTEDGGENWTRYDSFSGVPDMTYVNDLEASLHDPHTVFAAFNNHKKGDFRPYLLKSTDRGQSWQSIAGDLPERGSVYTIVQDHLQPDLLFAGTEFGIFVTLNGGENWVQLKGGIPTISVRELEIQRRESDLVAASFGRGFYVLDDYSPLRTLSDDLMAKEAHLFPVKHVWMYVEDDPLGTGDEGGFRGAGYFTAPNPPFGATFTVYRKEGLQNPRELRLARRKELSKDEQDVPYPTWEEFKEEDRAEDPAVTAIIKDESGNVVRKLSAPTSAGIHRLTWDLRYPSLATSEGGRGPLVVPGTYTVEFERRVEGEVTTIVPPAPFDVTLLEMPTLPAPDREEVVAFQKQAGDLLRAAVGASGAIGEAKERIQNAKRLTRERPELDPALGTTARDLELRLLDIEETLHGDPTKPRRNEPALPGLLGRIYNAAGATLGTLSAPTETHKANYEIVAGRFNELLDDLKQLVEKDLASLEQALEEAGVPWTPGRGVPNWER